MKIESIKGNGHKNKDNMKDQVSRKLLLRALKIIDKYRGYSPKRSFSVYYETDPEMKEIREALGSYADIKDEVIDCNSISINKTK